MLSKGFEVLADLGVDVQKTIKSYSNRNLDRDPVKSFDGLMFDSIIERIESRDANVALELRRAMKDERITNSFCISEQLFTQLERFTNPESFTHSKWNYINYQAAWNLFREMVPIPQTNLNPLLINESSDISDVISNPDASAGFLAYQRKKKDVPQLIKRAAMKITENYDLQLSFPAIALTRAQITDYVDDDGHLTPENIRYKTRLVMCVDAASAAVEAQFAIPVMEYFKLIPQYAGGSDDAHLSDFLIGTCSQKHWISVDYSKFDASIQWWLIKDIFNYLSEYFSSEHKKAFDWMSNNFIHMDILMPDGKFYKMKKGIKSGSSWTQLIGTIANQIMLLTGLCEQFGHTDGDLSKINLEAVRAQIRPIHSNKSSKYTMCAMGDDSILFTYTPVDVKRLSTYLDYMFKAKITLDGEKGFKAGNTHSVPQFLKRYWHADGQSREEVEMWVHLIHPERRRMYEEYSPWHILYGYYLTFNVSMRKYFSEEELVKGMKSSSGGIDSLAQIALMNLPGSLRFQIISKGVDRAELVRRLKYQY